MKNLILISVLCLMMGGLVEAADTLKQFVEKAEVFSLPGGQKIAEQIVLAKRLEQLGFRGLAGHERYEINRKQKLGKLNKYSYKSFTRAEIETFLTSQVRKPKTKKEKEDARGKRPFYWSGSAIRLHGEVGYDEKGNLGYWEWEEEKIDDYYEKLPPEKVLKALEKAQRRKLFDSYTIGTVKKGNNVRLKDPLLLGRIDCTDRRFLIGWWK